MLPYWLLFAYFAIGAIWVALGPQRLQPGAIPTVHNEGVPAPRKDLATPLMFGGIAIALMIGLRYEVGTDWLNYLAQFEQFKRQSLIQVLRMSDPAYGGLNWLAKRFGAEIWFVNLTCGSLFVYGLLRFARSQANPWLAVAIAIPYLVVVVGMGYSRQAVAIGLSLAGLTAVLQASLGRFVLWILAASLFHRSAVVLIPVVAFAYSRNRLQAITIGLVGSLIGFYVLTRAEGLEHFRRIYVANRLDSAGAAIRLAMNLIPALIYLAMSRRFTNDDDERRLWLVFATLSLLSAIIWFVAPATTALDRLALFLIPLQLFVIGNLPRAFAGDRQGTMVVGVIIYSAIVQFVWFTFAANARYWVPYQFQLPGFS